MNVSELAKLDLYLKDNGVEYTSNPTDKIVKLFLLFDMVPIYEDNHVEILNRNTKRNEDTSDFLALIELKTDVAIPCRDAENVFLHMENQAW